MYSDKRIEDRIECTDCKFETLNLETHHFVEIPFQYVNRSANGFCAYYYGDMPICTGDVLFLTRSRNTKVYYQVRWIKMDDDDSCKFGLKVVNSQNRAKKKHPKSKKMNSFKYNKMSTENIDLGFNGLY